MKKAAPFGPLLKQLREDSAYSLRQLESATGISNGYLSQMESGRVGAPSPKILEKLAIALKYPYIELMRAAGHLAMDLPMAPVMRLGEKSHPLAELTEAERAEVVRFIERLKSKRTGRND